MKKIIKFIELSRWFNRKSQHYILGNWTVYLSWFDHPKKLFNYYVHYPTAYCRFMYYSRREIFSA